jgi:anti-anti-sigma factor
MSATTALNFSQTNRDGVLILELRGAVDSALVLEPVIELASHASAKAVIVVISDVDYINSAGFSALIRLSDAVTNQEKAIYFVGLQEKVHVVFNSIGAHSVLNIVPSLSDALARIQTSAKA